MIIPALRLDDLASPKFSPEVTEMFAGAAQFADSLPLEVEALKAAAIEQLGGSFTDFGPSEFV